MNLAVTRYIPQGALTQNEYSKCGHRSVIVSEVSSFQRLKCMQEWYILGAGRCPVWKGVLS